MNKIIHPHINMHAYTQTATSGLPIPPSRYRNVYRRPRLCFLVNHVAANLSPPVSRTMKDTRVSAKTDARQLGMVFEPVSIAYCFVFPSPCVNYP